MSNTKLSNKPKRTFIWLRRSIIMLLIIAVVVSIGGSLFLLAFAIVRSDAPNTQKVIDASNDFAVSMVKSREERNQWLEDVSPESWVLKTEDGIELQGYYIASVDSRSTDRGSPDLGPERTAVLIHGYRSTAATMVNYARLYYDRGFNVFMADNRAHGKSGGKYIGMGWLDRKDYLQWLDMVLERTGENTEIVLHGLSMGGAAVMMMSAETLPPQVKCIVNDSGYTSVFDEFKYQLKKIFGLPAFPLLYLANIEAKLLAGYSFSEASAINAVKKASVPILFIHGDIDDFNPAYMVYELYEAAQTAKELWVVRGANHGMAYAVDPEEYAKRVGEFCDRYMK